MSIVVITKGAHWRNPDPAQDEPRRFAHLFDPDDPEDVPHQAQNFLLYASCLGNHVGPHVLIGPDADPDDRENAHRAVEMSDWASVVETATGVRVEVR